MSIINQEIIDGCGVITINREDALNAINTDVIYAMKKELRLLHKNNRVGSIIITGTGERAFIAGADIKEMEALNSTEAMEFAKRGQDITRFIEEYSKPVIAAINGYALGGGCEIALACHIRIASTKAMFGQPEVKLGIIPGWGGTQRLPRLVGKGYAIEIITTGALINAQKAHRIGLVNYVVEPNQLMEKAIEIGKQINSAGPIAVKYSLDAIRRGSELSQIDGLHNEAQLFGLTFNTQDKSEGLKAFIEKREPKFTGN